MKFIIIIISINHQPKKDQEKCSSPSYGTKLYHHQCPARLVTTNPNDSLTRARWARIGFSDTYRAHDRVC